MPASADQKPESLLDLVDRAAVRFGDRRLLAIWTEDGIKLPWSANELIRRSKLVAWRLHATGIQRGDRILLLSEPNPRIGALAVGQMRVGAVCVPLDLHMGEETIRRIAASAETRWLVVGESSEPVERAAVLDGIRILRLHELIADADASFPADWEAQVAAWPRPAASDLYAVMYTSGTTGTPRGVMLTHATQISAIETGKAAAGSRWKQVHRILSFSPVAHIGGQSELYYCLDAGIELLYCHSRTPKVIFEAMRQHRMNSLGGVPQMLDLWMKQIERDAEREGRLGMLARKRRMARFLPYWARRRLFRRELLPMGGELRTLGTGAAYLFPSLQRSWEDMGIVVRQGYGSTETGLVASTSQRYHPTGVLGKPPAGATVDIAEDGEILFRGPSVTSGYWRDPEATRAAFDEKGRFRTGDVGRLDKHGNLILVGRKRNIIVLPNGFNVYPEDIELALRGVGLGDSVVTEARPGQIVAVVLDPEARQRSVAGPAVPTPEERVALRERIEAGVRSANAALTVHQRVDSWLMWPDPDFPRTHTMKIRREPVRELALAQSEGQRSA